MDYVYTAESDTGDHPWMIAAWPGLTDDMFVGLVLEKAEKESIPNPDEHISHLTLCRWSLAEAGVWLHAETPMAVIGTWGDMFKLSSYRQVRWVFPGEWIVLELGEEEPRPSASWMAANAPAGHVEDDGYALDDPKSSGYHDRVAGIWDNRGQNVMTTYKALFQVLVTIIVSEADDGTLTVTAAGVEFDDSFVNLWHGNDEELISDHDLSSATGRPLEIADKAMEILDAQLAKDQSGVSTLRLVADLIEGGKKL